MRKILFFTLVFLSIQQVPAWALDIVVVQSARLPAYNSALQGFQNTVLKDIPARGLKSIQPHTITSNILSEIESPNALRQKIIRQHPDLLLVIGSSSLSLFKGVTSVPIIYLMVPYPELLAGDQDNITGITMNITPGQQLGALVRTIPRIKSIGLLYDPDQTGAFVKEAEDFAEHNNLTLMALPVKAASEVPGQLAKLRGRTDCYWMLPDRTVVTPQTMDLILLFSLENRLPVLTFSEKYLEMGATLSVSFDPQDMGKQAGELALRILDNPEGADLEPLPVRKINVRANHMAAKILGVVIEELINQEQP